MRNFIKNNTRSIGMVLSKIYGITILSVCGTFAVSYLIRDICNVMFSSLPVAIICLGALSLLRSLFVVEDLMSFIGAKLIDSALFASMFWLTFTLQLAEVSDLLTSFGVGLLFFIIAGISSIFIKEESYNALYFVVKVLFRCSLVLGFICFILFLANIHYIWLLNISTVVSLVFGSVAVTYINRSIIANPDVNILAASDMLSYFLMYIIREVFFFILRNKRKNN